MVRLKIGTPSESMTTINGSVERTSLKSSASTHPPNGSGARGQNGNVTHRNGDNNKTMSTSRRSVERTSKKSSASADPPNGSGARRQNGGNTKPLQQRRRMPRIQPAQSATATASAAAAAEERRAAVLARLAVKKQQETAEPVSASAVQETAEPVASVTVEPAPKQHCKSAPRVTTKPKVTRPAVGGGAEKVDNLNAFLEAGHLDEYNHLKPLVKEFGKDLFASLGKKRLPKRVYMLFKKSAFINSLRGKSGAEIMGILHGKLQEFANKCRASLLESCCHENQALMNFVFSLDAEQIYTFPIGQRVMDVIGYLRGVLKHIENTNGVRSHMVPRFEQLFITAYTPEQESKLEEFRCGEAIKMVCDGSPTRKKLAIFTDMLKGLMSTQAVEKVYDSMSTGMSIQEAFEAYRAMKRQLDQDDVVRSSFPQQPEMQVKELTTMHYGKLVLKKSSDSKTYSISDLKSKLESLVGKLDEIHQVFGDEFTVGGRGGR